MQEHTHTTHTQKRLITHTDLLKNSWMIRCTGENSNTLHTELQILNMY